MYRSSMTVLFYCTLLCSTAAAFSSTSPRHSRLDGKFAFPMRVPPQISGSFGEFRSNHLHKGVDIRTFSQNGIPVYSMEDGYVKRLLGSSYRRGFGQALYLKHDNKYTSVYGHLTRLSDTHSLEAGWQLFKLMSPRSYFSVYMPPDLYRVKRGQPVAYSGERGSGVSHLHFELWDGDNHPVNPWHSEYLNVVDADPPVLQSAYIFTEDYVVTSGNRRIQSCRLKKIKSGATPVYKCNKTLKVDGWAGLRIKMFDRANARNKLSVYTYSLFLNDRKIYTVEIDKIKGNEKYHEDRVYDKNRSGFGPTRYTYYLYYKYRNTRAADLPSYVKFQKNNGWVVSNNFKEGSIHRLRAVIKDSLGNTAVALFKIKKVKGKEQKKYGPPKRNLEKGRRYTRKLKGAVFKTRRLKKSAYLKVYTVRKKTPSYLKRISRVYRVKWRPGRSSPLTVYIYSGYSGRRSIYSTSGRRLRGAYYSRKHRAYIVKRYWSSTFYLADDRSRPTVGISYHYGPLSQDHLTLPVYDRGSGVDTDKMDVYIDGKQLSESEIKAWNIFYDHDRHAFKFPTGFEVDAREYKQGRIHTLWFRAYDHAGNRSKLWKGYINMNL